MNDFLNDAYFLVANQDFLQGIDGNVSQNKI